MADAAIDLALLALFGLQHAIMARPAFKRRWTRLVPQPLERSTYVLVSSAVTFLLTTWAIIIRPDFGRDDEVNAQGELHHSEGFYYTHRVASIFWGPDFRKGVDRKTVMNRRDLSPIIATLLGRDFR